MPTDKRERQRASRVAKSESQRLAAKRRQRNRTVRNVAVILVFGLIAAFAVSALGGDDGQDTATGDTSSTTVADTSSSIEATTTTLANPDLAAEVLERDPPSDPEPPAADLAKDALNVETLIEGEGEPSTANDIMTVHYYGVLADGTVFDQSWERGEPYTPVGPTGEPGAIGTASVIPGWQQGLVGLKVGERARVEIGSELAYGSTGQGDIPPDAPLVFIVDVVDIQPG